MHDYFDILGVAPDARGLEVADARRRHLATPHPDVQDGEVLSDADLTRAVGATDDVAGETDAALDFAAIGPVVARMRAAFFGSPRP